MPRDSNGNTQPLPGTIVSEGQTIQPSQHNPALVDLYAMMAQSLSRDGQGGMRTSLAMNGFQLVNLGEATQPGNAVPFSQFQNAMPIGSVIDFCGVNAPSGWLLCFGQQVSRTVYSDLFALINVSFGIGNGTTTFNLPDLRGRVVGGRDDMGGSDAGRLSGFFGQQARQIGGSLGVSAHALTVSEMPSHNHGGVVSASGLHTHSIPRGLAGSVGEYAAAAGQQPSTSFESSSDGLHNHTISSQGGNGLHTNAQPTFILNKIIKVSY